MAICNTDTGDTKLFQEFKHQLSVNVTKITVPHAGANISSEVPRLNLLMLQKKKMIRLSS